MPVYNPLEYSFAYNPSRIFGTSYQVTNGKPLFVSYSLTHTITLTLVVINGSSQVYLETSVDGTTWQIISQTGYADGVALAVNLTKSQTSNVQGIIQPGYYWRLRSVLAGGGTNAIVNSEEVVLP